VEHIKKRGGRSTVIQFEPKSGEVGEKQQLLESDYDISEQNPVGLENQDKDY